MPDRREHRGPHPEDEQDFGPSAVPQLTEACADLSFLLSRGYAATAAVELVGNRYALRTRARRAVLRCACSDAPRRDRARRLRRGTALRGATVWIDGFNVLTTVEAALAGGVVLVGRDRADRDMASMHGHWRRVAETDRALTAVTDTLDHAGVAAAAVELCPAPDRLLIAAPGEVVLATADSGILDRAAASAWWPLAAEAVAACAPDAWRVDLGTPDGPPG